MRQLPAIRAVPDSAEDVICIDGRGADHRRQPSLEIIEWFDCSDTLTHLHQQAAKVSRLEPVIPLHHINVELAAAMGLLLLQDHPAVTLPKPDGKMFGHIAPLFGKGDPCSV